MTPDYKLTYYDARGIAETARYLFKYGGIEFEDIRITKQEWPQTKEKSPLGHVPFLEYKDKKAGQSLAICRYLAKVVKLAGNDDWEDLEIDGVVDTINDLYSKLTPLYHEMDEGRKVLIDTANKETLPYYLPRLEALVKKNGGFLALGRLTWADIFFATITLLIDLLLVKDSLEYYPNLKALRENVNAIPAINKWIEERPKTLM